MGGGPFALNLPWPELRSTFFFCSEMGGKGIVEIEFRIEALG